MSEAQQQQVVFHPAQAIIARDQHRYRVACCGRRFGKSFLVSWEMFAIAVSNEDARVPYYAPTRDDARDIMWGMLKKVCEPLTVDVNESRLEILVKNNFGGTSLIVLYGWESVQERGKGVGLKNTHIFFDEVSKYREFWRGWEEILSPTLIDLKGGATFISTPNGFNHFYDLYNYENDIQGVNAKGEWKSFHFTSYDNPHISPDEINDKKILVTEDRFAQEYLADFRKTEGLVYKEFDRARHLTQTVPEYVVETFGGVDFGFTHPTAVITIKKDYKGIYYVTDEWVHTGKTEDEVVEYVAGQKFNKVYPDPENASAIEALKRKHVNVRDVTKGRGSVVSGINNIRELLKAGRLMIHTSCKHVTQSFEMYSYAETAKGQSIANEIPAHDYSDACFVAGTKVNGRNIEDIGICTGVKEVWEYEIAGEKIIATPNHKIVTQRGLVMLDTLRYDDCIWKKKSLFMQVGGGLVTHNLLKRAIEITSVVIRRELEARKRLFTDLSGKKQTDLSQKDSLFIILMAIPAIIRWIILSVLILANTLLNIGRKKKEQKQKSISKKLSKLLRIGQKQKKVKNEEPKWEKQTPTLCTTKNQSKEHVMSAEKSISVKNQEEDSAISTVVKKRYVGLEPVYNLRTRSGMYHANNLLVSNCDAIRYCLYMDNNTSHSKTPTVSQSRPVRYGASKIDFNKFK